MALTIDSAQLSREIDELAEISDAEPPAVTRIVFTPADLKARAWLRSRCQEAGLAVRVDADWQHLREVDWLRTGCAGGRYRLAHRCDSECRKI